MKKISDLAFSYNSSFYDSKQLKHFAYHYGKNLPPDVTTVISGGASGASIVSSMLALRTEKQKRLSHLFFYGNESQSHTGEGIKEHSGRCYGGNFAIIDDLIDSGNTIISLFERLITYLRYEPHVLNESVIYIIVWKFHREDFRADFLDKLSRLFIDMKIKLIVIEDKG